MIISTEIDTKHFPELETKAKEVSERLKEKGLDWNPQILLERCLELGSVTHIKKNLDYIIFLADKDSNKDK